MAINGNYSAMVCRNARPALAVMPAADSDKVPPPVSSFIFFIISIIRFQT